MNLNLTDLFTNGTDIITILIAVLIVIVGNILNSGISELIKNKISKKNTISLDNEKKISDLKNLHPIFNDIKYYRDVKIPAAHLGGPVRTIVFRDCLIIYYNCCLEICNEITSTEITSKNFLQINKNAITKLLINTHSKLIENNIPDIVIQKFFKWCEARTEHIIGAISDIDSSTVITSTIEKEFLVLSVLQEVVYFILMDAEKTLKGLNGELSGTIYKGLIIEPLEHKKEE